MNFFDKIPFELQHLILIGCIILTAAIFTRAIRWLMNKSIASASERLRIDPTRYSFFKNTVTLIIWTVALAAIILLIPKLKAVAVAMFAGAGIFMAIVGFAAQQAFANIIGGIFIVIFRPFRVGDLIRIGTNYFGEVEDITLRHTVITDFENRRIIIPNSVISSETVVNSSISDEKICEFVVFGISYDSDLDRAIAIITEEAEQHPSCIDNRTDEEKADNNHIVKVVVVGFGDSSVNLRASVWSNDPIKAREMRFDLNKSVKERFDQEGIEIPFPYRTIVYKNTDQSNQKNKKPHE